MNFQEKCFLCNILSADQTSLSDCHYFLRYWTAHVMQLFVFQFATTNFEINLIFLIKPILYITRKSRQKFSNWSKKTFFIIFKGLLADKYCLRLESAPLLTIFAKRSIFDIWQGFGTLLVQVLSFRQRTDSLVYYQLSNYEKTYYTIESFGIKHSNIRTKLSFKFK